MGTPSALKLRVPAVLAAPPFLFTYSAPLRDDISDVYEPPCVQSVVIGGIWV